MRILNFTFCIYFIRLPIIRRKITLLFSVFALLRYCRTQIWRILHYRMILITNCHSTYKTKMAKTIGTRVRRDTVPSCYCRFARPCSCGIAEQNQTSVCVRRMILESNTRQRNRGGGGTGEGGIPDQDPPSNPHPLVGGSMDRGGGGDGRFIVYLERVFRTYARTSG